MPVWNAQQSRALDAVGEWLRRGDKPFFYLAGYAGTGKTTLARHLAELVSGPVIFASYTGKAAHVLQKKGCPDARTVHSTIYVVGEKSKRRLQDLEAELERRREEPGFLGTPAYLNLLRAIEDEKRGLKKPIFTLNFDSPLRTASLLVLDECSMLDNRIVDDIMYFECPVLALGDPFQLPPVKGTGFFTSSEPDFMLTDVERTARDNPIVALATRVRGSEELEPGAYGDSRVLRLANFDKNAVPETTQIVVGRNRTRRRANEHMRTRAGRTSPLPVTDDKLVCLRNDREAGLLNGALWTARDVLPGEDGIFPMTIESEDDGIVTAVEAHEAHFRGEEVNPWTRKDAQEFDFGYALTCHKAQGSEWADVLVVDEGACFRQDRYRWLYTALTRASEKVEVVLT